jgi:hypothetical protein
MPAPRTMPPARAADVMLRSAGLLAVALAAIAAAYLAGKRAGAVQELMAAAPAEARRIAFVRKQPCGPGWCEALWLGTTREDAVQVAMLAAGAEHCDEIAWANDGYRVGFVVNGYQLRIFDGVTGKQVSQVNLLEPDGIPSSRLARGVTFSQNGAAVTFDDCPRGHSGCKSGLIAVR